MKKIISIILLLATVALHAQGRLNEKREQIRALKIAFLTTELNLSAEESAKFWPLYTAYEDKQREIKQDKRKQYWDTTEDNIEQMTPKEAAAYLAKSESMEDNLYVERKKFIQSLKEFLPALKIVKLKKAEAQFNRKLLQQVRNKKNKD